MRPKISVIIPCYNLENYLEDCLASIAKQSTDKAEYIFVDDGSSDNTPYILEQFCHKVNGTRVIHQNNAGVSAARNTALNYCNGEYIYLLDGDDILTDNAIESMIQLSREADAVISPVILKRDSLTKFPMDLPFGIFSPQELFEKSHIFPTMPQLLYKRDIIQEANLRFDDKLCVGEVYDFTIRFFNYASKIAVVSQCFFYYVMRNSSATHHPNFAKDRTVVKTLESYYSEGAKFSQYPSFNTTAFKMLMSFTYNKYAKLHLNGDEVKGTLEALLDNPVVKNCVDSVAKCSATPIKERLLALYVKYTGIKGYNFLSKVV